MPGLTRRTALTTALGAAASLPVCGAAVSAEIATARPFFTEANLPIGVQLYTLGPDLAARLDADLAELVAAGIGEVELAGHLGRSPPELRKAIERAGLKCPSAHVPTRQGGAEPDLETRLPQVIKDAQDLGLEYVVMPFFYIPDRFASGPASGEDGLAFIRRVVGALTVDDWKSCADFANRTAKALHAEGLKFAYHNHNPEFAPIGGTTGFDILMAHTDPDLVKVEMDAGWAFAAGQDPIGLLNAHPGRFRLMHVKDVKATTRTNFHFAQDPTEVGSGVMDWAHILPAARAAGVTHFFVEQEPPYAGPRMASIRKSSRYLQGLVAR